MPGFTGHHLLGPTRSFKDTEPDPMVTVRLPLQVSKPDINPFGIYVWFTRPYFLQALSTHRALFLPHF